jgi:hypothetical protein
MLLENDLAALAREITSRHRVDRRSLLPLAARRDAVAARATRRLTNELRTGTAPFPINMKSIRIGHWKSSSSAAINNCHNLRTIAASQFNQHEQETPDVRVLLTPY